MSDSGTDALESLVRGLEDVRRALPRLERELERARRDGDRGRAAELLAGVATARAAAGDYGGAIAALKEATAAFTRMKRLDDAAVCRLQLGRLRRFSGDDAQAMVEHRRAAAALEKVGRLDGAGEAEIEVGDMLLAKEQWDAAHERFARALSLLERAGAPRGEGRRILALRGIAAARQAQGRVDEALQMYLRIEAEAHEAGDGAEVVMARFARAGLLGLAGRADEAAPLWSECLDAARQANDPRMAAQCTGNLATWHAERRDDTRAMKMALEGRDAALLCADAATYVAMATLLSALHVRAGNPERAYETLANAGADLARAMGDAAQAADVMAPYLETLERRLGGEVYARVRAHYDEARRPS